MKQHFVPYEQAVTIKELNFREPCFARWTKGLTEFESSSISPARIFSSKFNLNDTQSCLAYANNPEDYSVAAPTYQQAFSFLLNHEKLIDKGYMVIECSRGDWELLKEEETSINVVENSVPKIEVLKILIKLCQKKE